MEKIQFYFVLVTMFVFFNTGNSATTKKDEKQTSVLSEQNSLAKTLSELDFNAIMDECNASFRIDIALLEYLNNTNTDVTIRGKTELFLYYQLMQIDEGFLFAEYLKSLNDSGSFPDETEATPKCFIKCYFSKMGMMSEDGELNKDVAKMVFQGERDGKVMENIADMIDKCLVGRTESCQCEKAYAFARCVMEAEIEKYENK